MTLDGSPRPWLENVREAEWSADGMTLATIRVANSEDLLEYPIGTILHRAPGYLSDLRVSPDGNHVAFFEHPVRYDDRGFVKIWDRGGSVRVLAGEYWGMQGLAWRQTVRPCTSLRAAPHCRCRTDRECSADPVVSRQPPDRDLWQREVQACALFREGRCWRATNRSRQKASRSPDPSHPTAASWSSNHQTGPGISFH